MNNKVVKLFVTVILLILLVFVTSPIELYAEEVPKTDGFLDGTNQTEQIGISELPEGLEMLIYQNQPSSIPSCSESYSSNSEERAKCLDKNSSDLFVILATDPEDPNSDFPDESSTAQLMDFFSIVTGAEVNSGLSIAIHPLKQPVDYSGSRDIADEQHAIRATEHKDSWTQGDFLGYSVIGTPNSAGETIIYTRRIREYICDKCGFDITTSYPYCEESFFTSNKCRTNTTPELIGEGLVRKYVRYINHHEIGHSVFFNHVSGSEYIGY